MAAAKRHLDFIVIGAQKAGTTSLFEYLRRHPQLVLPAAKEVPYFSHESRYRGDWDEYLRKAFPFADAGSLWGTVTPHYMVGGLYEPGPNGAGATSDERTVPRRIRERLPEVRLIAIMRDPVERARSHHAMAVLNGWERRDFAAAARELLAADALEHARRVANETTGYIVWGEYGRILRGYLEVFERERVLALYTSELSDDPAAVVRRVCEFLGVSTDYMPDNLGESYRRGAVARRLGWLDLPRLQDRVASSNLARRMWHSLPEPSRRRVDKAFDRVNYLTDLWNRRGATGRAAAAEADLEARLRAHFEPDARLLAELLGSAPHWAQP